MFGRLVMSTASTCAAVRPSITAARRRGRESDTSGDRAGQAAQGELVAVRSQANDDTDGRRRQHRMTPFGLAPVDVRDVDLDEWNGDAEQRVAKCEAGV